MSELPLRTRAGYVLSALSDRLLQPSSKGKPHFSEYTTADNPEEVPLQREAYFIAVNDYLREGDTVLDVGCGVGYGMNLLSIKAASVTGIDVDRKAVDYCRARVLGKNPKVGGVDHYDGEQLPYEDGSFDVVTTIDVIEHVPDYDRFLRELLRVSRRAVVVSTPNRRPEFTNADGTPRNHWHLREWSRAELGEILAGHEARVEWHHVNGTWDGPHTLSTEVQPDTQTLTPALLPAA